MSVLLSILHSVVVVVGTLVGIGVILAVWVAYSYCRDCRRERQGHQQTDFLISGHR